MPDQLIQAMVSHLKGLLSHYQKGKIPTPEHGHKKAFVDKLYQAYTHAKTPIPFSWIWPQAALESNWGRSDVAKDCNNLAGMTDMGTRHCSHCQPASEGGVCYAGFRDWQDWIERYTAKITHEGNLFQDCWLRGQKVMARDGEVAGALEYWRCLTDHNPAWSGVSDYDKRLASVAGIKGDSALV